MKTHPTDLAEVVFIEPTINIDERGLFYESHNHAEFSEALGVAVEFVQDNHSYSVRGVLRGLHYQTEPMAQGKLVRAVSGSVFDVAVDIRRSSPTFGAWVGVELSAENHRQLWVPEGFAHGFVVTSESATVLYKATAYYSPEHDRSIRWDDPNVAVTWPIDQPPILSSKDAEAPLLRDADVFP